MNIRISLSVALVAAVLPAQATWIVDAAGSGNFTSLAAAYDFAQPGDTLLVRPGSYAGFARQPAKGMRILGTGPGVSVGALSFVNVPAREELHLGGFVIDSNTTPFPVNDRALEIEDCGRLLLTDLDVLGPRAYYGFALEGGTGIWLDHCTGVLAEVRVRGGDGVHLAGGVGAAIFTCSLAISGGEYRSGDSLIAPQPAQAGLLCAASTIAMDEAVVAQGTSPSGEGLLVFGGRVLVSNRLGGIESVFVAPWVAGTVEVDGQVPPWFPAGAQTTRSQPGLTGPATVATGSTLTWTVHGGVGNFGAAAASLGIEPLSLPSSFDTTLFTPAHPTAVFYGVVSIGASGTASYSLQVPNVPQLVDTHVFLQVAGWLSQPTWKATGVAVTRIR